jgi:hypothetical protein
VESTDFRVEWNIEQVRQASDQLVTAGRVQLSRRSVRQEPTQIDHNDCGMTQKEAKQAMA